ncbi:MAG: hypothetical protein JWM16_1115 [Verrucomicrobiales bacterium]|nr:hypothetical protein [Verrucomicrobiales bacterium]
MTGVALARAFGFVWEEDAVGASLFFSQPSRPTTTRNNANESGILVCMILVGLRL